METITIDIINDKAVLLLKDMELLKLIRVHRSNLIHGANRVSKYKGTMTKEPLAVVENQLRGLRKEWE